MSENGPTSPDDPAWVDDIVRRALERADDGGIPAPTTVQSTADPVTPAGPAPTTAQPTVGEPDGPPIAQPTVAEPNGPPAAQSIVAEPQNTPTAHSRVGEPDDPPMAQAPPKSRLAADGIAMQQQSAAPASRASVQDRPLPRAEDVASSLPYAETTHQPNHAGPYPDSGGGDLLNTAIALDTDEPDNDAMSNRMRGFLEWGAVVVGALAVALLIKTFLMQAYFIPSSSMESTLNIGDRVLVNKLSYQFGEIGRGDLVVFNRPPNQANGEDDLIKRVIGLPGDTVEISDGRVFITEAGTNEVKELREPYLEEGVSTTGFVDTSGCVTSTPTTCVVPDDHIFVLGDNRPGSKDGRFFGPIDEDLVVGRAFLRVWPLADISFL